MEGDPSLPGPRETHLWRLRLDGGAAPLDDCLHEILARYGTGATALTFSVSRAGAQALIGVARDRKIGVDLEEVRAGVIGDAEAARILSDAERRALDRLPPGIRERALVALWAQQEAYAKARGFEADACDGWSLRMLDVGPGFTAALVVEGEGGSVRWSTLEDV